MSRPELTGHASLFYNAKEARKYDSSSRMMGVQREITERAIELLRLPNDRPSFILDVGCGSGLSGQVLEQHGHFWVGCDVSRDMLTVAGERMEGKLEEEEEEQQQQQEGQTMDAGNDRMEYDDDNEHGDDDSNGGGNQGKIRRSTGDLMHHDMGTGLPFRPATFDSCVSISALQWLCYSNAKKQIPKRRLTRFFSSLYRVLRRGGRAVLQFYPETAEQAILISECASRVGFAGGIVVDYPNSTKAKKHYLVLSFDKHYKTPSGLNGAEGIVGIDDDDGQPQRTVRTVRVERDQGKKKRPPKKKKGVKTKEWIIHKKETQRKKGKNVRPDSKYTARRRPTKF